MKDQDLLISSRMNALEMIVGLASHLIVVLALQLKAQILQVQVRTFFKRPQSFLIGLRLPVLFP